MSDEYFFPMNQSIPYSILFVDPRNSHGHTGQNLAYLPAAMNLDDTLASYRQTKITVCVCCQNSQPVVTILQQSRNVGAIILCTRHYPNQHGVTNQPVIIRENLFNDDEHWQIEAHKYALDANANPQVNVHIRQIVERFLQQQLFPTHGERQ